MNKIHFLKDKPKVSLHLDEVQSPTTPVFCTALSVLLWERGDPKHPTACQSQQNNNN